MQVCFYATNSETMSEVCLVHSFCLQAEEELKKAQRVFDELNVGLQDELPTLWDR